MVKMGAKKRAIQSACKPGSVRGRAMRPCPWMAIHLADACCQTSQATYPGISGRIASVSWNQPTMPLYGLASDGVYLAGACRQSRGALLPHLFTLTAPERGGLFSVALSLGSPPLAVNQHPDPVKPGLSSAGDRQARPRQQPSSPLDCRADNRTPPPRRSSLTRFPGPRVSFPAPARPLLFPPAPACSFPAGRPEPARRPGPQHKTPYRPAASRPQ